MDITSVYTLLCSLSFDFQTLVENLFPCSSISICVYSPCTVCFLPKNVVFFTLNIFSILPIFLLISSNIPLSSMIDPRYQIFITIYLFQLLVFLCFQLLSLFSFNLRNFSFSYSLIGSLCLCCLLLLPYLWWN